jgi:hypothetical protein
MGQSRIQMKFIVLIYNDPVKLEALPPGRFEADMRTCFAHTDELQETGRLIESQMLKSTANARSVRVQNGRQVVLDGPFAETKEVLGGFNIIEAENMDEAVRIAASFPWSKTGCVEVRPIEDLHAVRRRVTEQAEPVSQES